MVCRGPEADTDLKRTMREPTGVLGARQLRRPPAKWQASPKAKLFWFREAPKSRKGNPRTQFSVGR
eukprot:1287472-Pyramimonas_sp.AAC.1